LASWSMVATGRNLVQFEVSRFATSSGAVSGTRLMSTSAPAERAPSPPIRQSFT